MSDEVGGALVLGNRDWERGRRNEKSAGWWNSGVWILGLWLIFLLLLLVLVLALVLLGADPLFNGKIKLKVICFVVYLIPRDLLMKHSA